MLTLDEPQTNKKKEDEKKAKRHDFEKLPIHIT